MNIKDNFWSFFNEVRRSKSIGELREIVISLIFLKHADDEYSSNPFSNINVPEKSQFSVLVENLDNSDLLNYLWDAFDAIEIENYQLRDTLSNFNFRNRFKSKDDFYLIKNLIIKICEFSLLESDISFSNFIGELLSKFALSEGRRGGDINTPDSVSQLMMELLNPEKGIVLDSTCGIGGFFQVIEENYPDNEFQFYGQEYNSSTLVLAKLRFAFNVKNSIEFGEGKSTLSDDQFPKLKADYVIMHPPFNVRTSVNEINENDPRFEYGVSPKGNANMAWIQHANYHLNNYGKAAILLSNGSLNSRGKEAQIRKNLIEADLIESIISLPSQLLTNTSISVSIWLLNKNKLRKKEVLFLDATHLGIKSSNKTQKTLNSESISKIVQVLEGFRNNNFIQGRINFYSIKSLEDIRKQEYQLNPLRYVTLQDYIGIDLSETVLLANLIEYIKPLQLDATDSIKGVSIKDLSSSPDNYLLDVSVIEKGNFPKNYKLLRDNSLLLARLGNKIKPTFFTSDNGKIGYAANSIFAYKVDDKKVNLDYLIAELHKDYVLKQLNSFRGGSAIQNINKSAIENVRIKLPEPKFQKEIVEKERESRFQSAAKNLGFEKEIEKLKKAQMKDLGSKKHNIMQHLNNVKASSDVLATMMDLNNGVLKADTIIDPKRGVTVEKRFQRLQESLSKVIYYVDNITNELKYEAAEIIDPIKFIKECKERGLQNDLFTIEVIVESDTFQGQKPFISISKNDFEEIYNNILENAMNHGFVDNTKSYIFRISIAYIDNFLEVNFINNGKPFPKGMAEKFDVKGEKAGVTAGTGIGLWKVAEIAKHFDCKLEVLDEPENEFPVGFKFQFNLETL